MIWSLLAISEPLHPLLLFSCLCPSHFLSAFPQDPPRVPQALLWVRQPCWKNATSPPPRCCGEEWDPAGEREEKSHCRELSTATSRQGPPSPRLLDRKACPGQNGFSWLRASPSLGLSLSLFPRELSHNQIEELPSLHRCQKLEEM